MEYGLKSDNKELSIKENMLWNSFGSLVNLGCQWLVTVLIVRMANGYEAAGQFSLAMSVYNIFAPIGQYRMYTYQVTDVTGENTTGEYLTFRFITNATALVLCFVYALFTCSPASIACIILYALYRSIALTIDVFHACDQCNHRMDYIGKSLAAQGILSAITFVVVFHLTANLELTLLLMALALLIIGVVYDYPKSRQFGPIRLGISFDKARYLVVRCLPIVLASIAASAAASYPRQYLSMSYGEAVLGIYAAAAAPVAIIQTGASYIYNPLLGYFSEYYAHKKKDAFVGTFVKCTLGIVCVCLICAFGVSIFGEQLLILVYGDKMSGYVHLLYSLVVLALLTGYMWFINDLLMALRNFRATFIGSVVSLIATMVSLPLIDWLGIDGVTPVCLVSCIAAIVIMGLCLLIQLRGYWKD